MGLWGYRKSKEAHSFHRRESIFGSRRRRRIITLDHRTSRRAGKTNSTSTRNDSHEENIEQQRGKNNHRSPSSYKSDEFGSGVRNRTKSVDSYSSSTLGRKKSLPTIDSDFKHWTLLTEGFPPGITVDELKKYSRRKQPPHLIPNDNLHVNEGTTKPCKSEYTSRFKAYDPGVIYEGSDRNLTKKDTSFDEFFFFVPEYKNAYTNYPRKRPVLKRPPNNLEPLKDPMEFTTEINSQYVAYPNSERRKLLRRSTALKPEGSMTSETEVRKEYVGYPNPERARMIRRLPTLKVEGEFEPMTTEQRDKFIAFAIDKRPIMEKKKTLLKMEGDFDFLTEKNLSYVPHDPTVDRPRIKKRSTSLKLDGELEFSPEYRESFVDYNRTRPITYKPNGSMRCDGELQKDTETKTQFVNYENVEIPASAKPENNLHMEGELIANPEYKTNYIDFPRERPLLRRPLNQIKPEGNLQVLTESSENFKEFPAFEKPESLRRPSNLQLEGNIDFLSEKNDKFKKFDTAEKTETVKMTPNLKLEGNMDFKTEKADKFGFLLPEREPSGRRPSSLKLEGEFLCQPEYLKSQADFRNSGNSLKTSRNFRSTPSSPRRKPKENVKTTFDEDKKFILGTPHRRLSSMRHRRGSRSLEKSLKFDLPNDNLPKLRDERVRNDFPEKFKASHVYLSRPTVEPSLVSPKEFQAFQVLDVKGQLGCQGLRKDGSNYEKLTSDEEGSLYRLEVSTANKPDFRKRDDWKMFPTSAVSAALREETVKREKRKPEAFDKVVTCPEIPNYLLDYGPEEAFRCRTAKLSPLPPLNDGKQSFVVLNGKKSASAQAKDPPNSDKCEWEMPNWLSSSPIA